MRSIIKLLAVLVIAGLSCNLSAQINLGGRIQDKVNSRINNKIDRGIDKGLDDAENGVKNGNKKADSTAGKKPADKSKGSTKKESNPNAESEGTAPQQQSLASYSKYDFIAGEKVIFYDDFSEVAQGDFPANWNTNASGEVVTTNLFPGNWFKMVGEGSIALDEGIKLPDNYTMEFDVLPHPSGKDGEAIEFGFYLYSAANPKDLNEGGAVPGKVGIKMGFGYRADYSAYDETGYTLSGIKEDAVMKADTKYRLSFWVQKTRLRVYLDQVKIFDLPKVLTPGYQYNMMRFELWNAGEPLVTNFRVAAGLPDMRSKLITEGKLVSYGIYFDVNKDVVKPESYGTLKGIADVLKENPTVRVKIVGHTDSDGADAANLDLSKRRGASVKNELVKNFGIDASRLESDGMGESKPVAPNDTPVNKALNRRVEFIKL